MREIKHLSVHQWLRSASPDSQQPISPIGFVFLKLPPPPCAVLLVFILGYKYYIYIYQMYQTPILGYVLIFILGYIYIICIKHFIPGSPHKPSVRNRLRKYWTLLLEVAAVFAWIYFCTTGALDEGDGRQGRMGRMGRMRCDACVGG